MCSTVTSLSGKDPIVNDLDKYREMDDIKGQSSAIPKPTLTTQLSSGSANSLTVSAHIPQNDGLAKSSIFVFLALCTTEPKSSLLSRRKATSASSCGSSFRLHERSRFHEKPWASERAAFPSQSCLRTNCTIKRVVLCNSVQAMEHYIAS